jgi:hypothetical protein
MEVGEKTTVTVAAKPPWNDTGVRLEAGRTYRMSALGEWVDWRIPCGPAGYPSPNPIMRLAERFRRAPVDPWFALIGAMDRNSSSQFLIGAEYVYRPTRSGQLTCFANDVPGFYWNNTGEVELTIERLDSPAG